MFPASAQLTTASGWTSQRLEILRLSSDDSAASLRQTIASGWMPRLRSSVTEC